MNSCSNIKEQARENLLGHYRNLVASAFLYAVITSILLSAFSNMLVTNISGDTRIVSRIICSIAGIVIVLLLAGLFRSSLGAYHVKLARQEDPDSMDLLHPLKNHPDKFMGLALVHVAIVFVCMLPGGIVTVVSITMNQMSLLAIGIILLVLGAVLFISLFLSWALARFILLDDPYGHTVRDALRESANWMHGQRKFLLGMILSFIGWLFLGLATFTLGYLWSSQYVGQSLAVFYIRTVPADCVYDE